MSGWDGLAWTEVLLINAALASLLAFLVAGLERWRPKALWLHGLWLLVILRFVAPPMVPLEILPSGWWGGELQSHLGVLGQTEGTRTVEGMEMTPSLTASTTYLGTETHILPTSATASQLSLSSTLPSTLLADSFEWITDYLWFMLGAAWVLVGLVILGLTGRQVARLVVLVRNGASPDPHVQQLARDLADAVGLRRMPRIRVVNNPSLVSPMILSTLAGPVLLLPKALLDALNDDELSTVLVHEWAHVRRRDHWVRWPEWLALVVFWWNPAVWWARRALRRSEERCVDAWVLRLLPERRADYARALVETMALSAGSPRHSPVLSSGIETMNSMEGRLTMILQDTSPRRSSESSLWIRWAAWPVLVLALTLLPVWGPPLTAGGDEDSKAVPGLQVSEDASNNVLRAERDVLRAERLARERELLDEQSRQLETSHGDAKNETQERIEELQARSRELAERQDAAESIKEGILLQEKMQRLEQHWAMQSRSYEMRAAALEAKRLHLDAEAAALEGNEERARMLREEHRQRAEVLRERERQHAEQARAMQQQHLETERQRLQQRLEQLQEAGEKQAIRQLEGQLKRLQLEGKQLAHEQALRQEEIALQAAQEEAKRAMEAAQQEVKQRLESLMGQEKEGVTAALRAEQRAYQAKARAIEAERRQARAELRAKSLQAELPLRVEELRLAMEEVEDEKARQELRAELERVYGELGEILDKE